jgi:hypothetical protein
MVATGALPIPTGSHVRFSVLRVHYTAQDGTWGKLRLVTRGPQKTSQGSNYGQGCSPTYNDFNKSCANYNFDPTLAPGPMPPSPMPSTRSAGGTEIGSLSQPQLLPAAATAKPVDRLIAIERKLDELERAIDSLAREVEKLPPGTPPGDTITKSQPR